MGISAQQLLQSDPEYLQRQLAQQEMQRLNPTGGAAGAIGALLGRGVSNLAGGRGFFDVNDAGLRRVSDVQKIMSSTQFDPNNPVKYYEDLASSLQQAGYGDLAPMAFQEAAKFKKESVFGKVDPSKFTPASLERFQQTKNYKDLQPLDKVVSEYKTLSPADVRSRGLNPNTVYQEEVATGKLTQVGQSPAVVFNAPLMTSETEYAKGIGKTAAEKDTKQFEAAESAVNNLTKINTTLNELQTSDAVTGLGADVIKNVERTKALFLADKKAGKKVTDTEYLDALLGSDVFPMISALGIGARGLDTPAEREYLRQVFTGTITMNKDTLIKLTQIRKNIEEKAINKYNERVDKGEYNRFFKMQGREPVKFEIPTMPAAPQPGSVPGQKGWSAKEIK
jgi:hypothetical protein